MEFKIRKATRQDASRIARAVMMAIHDEGCEMLAGGKDRVPLLDDVFIPLAQSDNSQYSYLNSLVAEDPQGNVAGVIVGYDGARLHELRQAFVETANRVLGYNWKEEEFDEETTPDEFYLDSLAVFPEYRSQGLARKLIDAMVQANSDIKKPFAMLCEPTNRNAYELYTRMGFQDVGMRRFAGIPMRHLIRK